MDVRPSRAASPFSHLAQRHGTPSGRFWSAWPGVPCLPLGGNAFQLPVLGIKPRSCAYRHALPNTPERARLSSSPPAGAVWCLLGASDLVSKWSSLLPGPTRSLQAQLTGDTTTRTGTGGHRAQPSASQSADPADLLSSHFSESRPPLHPPTRPAEALVTVRTRCHSPLRARLQPCPGTFQI